MKILYLDNAATTKTSKKVVKEMNKYYTEQYGNPSSQHQFGENALRAIQNAKKILSNEINAKPHEIYFTSGGTESNNLAIIGLSKANQKKKTIITSKIEHPSISEVCSYLEKKGYKIVKIPVNKEGIVNLNILEKIIRENKDILVVSIMHVNNVIGAIQPIEKIAEMCEKYNVIFHTDAVQSFGKLKINVKYGISMLSASAHKINGPKGSGFLYIKDGIKISPIIYGGGQEKGLRSGTENVPGIVGFSKALEIHKKINKSDINKIRDKLILELCKHGKINGSLKDRIYNNIHISFPWVDSATLVSYLSKKGIYVSVGSACDSKKMREDEVLKAIGLDKKYIDGSIRISLNDDVKMNDVDYIVKTIKKGIETLRVQY